MEKGLFKVAIRKEAPKDTYGLSEEFVGIYTVLGIIPHVGVLDTSAKFIVLAENGSFRAVDIYNCKFLGF